MKVLDIAKNCTLFVCAIFLALIPAIGAADNVFARLFVFGDSLSDPGNRYAVTGETAKAPYEPIPSAAYAIGGHHFSNGRTWAERLAQNLNDNNGGKPALEKPGQYGNYAYGGARARNVGSGTSSGDQVGLFVGDHFQAPSEALYVIQFGANDIRDALFDPANAGSIVLQAVAAEIASIQTLYSRGARNFAIVNAPNIGRAPAVAAFGPVAIQAAQNLSEFHNQVLENGFALLGLPGLSQLPAFLPEINIYRIDMFGFVNDVAENPAAFGISDPFFPCLQFGVKSEAKCDNADERLFWDGIHPTAVAHSALGDIATAAVTID